MSEKCFCHLNGYKVKDADARKSIEAINKKIASGEIGGSGSSIPQYVQTEAARLASVVQARQNANTITGIFCSDLHTGPGYSTSDQMLKSIEHCGQAMALIRKAVHIDFAAMLGDIPWDGGETKAQALEVYRYVNGCLHEAFQGIPNFRTRGNHDWLAAGDVGMTGDQIFANIEKYNAGAVYDSDNRALGCCYRDFEDYKLRVVVINTCEDSTGAFSFSDAQNTWLAAALDLSDVGEGWKSVIVCHHPPEWLSSAGNLCETITTNAGVLCVFHGHTHNFLVGNVADSTIPRIAIPNACFGRENEYGKNGTAENSEGAEFGETTTYGKTAATASDTSFCVVTIDLEAGMIYADHYGAGYSRVISLDDTVTTYPVYYHLSNVTADNMPETAMEGASFGLNLTPADGYEIDAVTVYMGGVEVTSTAYNNGVINIGSVTGEIVVTVTAVESSGGSSDDGSSGTDDNLVPTSIDTDGSIYNGTGYITDYRLSSSGGVKAAAGAIASGYIPYTAGCWIWVTGSDDAAVGYEGNYIVLYDAEFNMIAAYDYYNMEQYGCSWDLNESGPHAGKYFLCVNPDFIENEVVLNNLAAAKYFRAGFGHIASPDDFYIALT